MPVLLSSPVDADEGIDPFITDSESECSKSCTNADKNSLMTVWIPLIYGREAVAVSTFTEVNKYAPVNDECRIYAFLEGEWGLVKEASAIKPEMKELCIMHKLRNEQDETVQAVTVDTEKSYATTPPISPTKEHASNNFFSKTFKKLIKRAEKPETCGRNPVFGALLENSADVPTFFAAGCKELAHRAQSTEGLFRLNGSLSVISHLQEAIDHDRAVDFSTVDAHAIAGLIKMYLRRLPRSLLSVNCYGQDVLFGAWQMVGAFIQNNQTQWADAAVEFLLNHALHPTHRALLNCLLHVLKDALMPAQEVTRMTAANLGACIGPNLLREPDAPGESLDVGSCLLTYLISRDEKVSANNDTFIVALCRVLFSLKKDAMPPSDDPMSESSATASRSVSISNASSRETVQSCSSRGSAPQSHASEASVQSALSSISTLIVPGDFLFIQPIKTADLNGWWPAITSAGQQLEVPHNYIQIVNQVENCAACRLSRMAEFDADAEN